MEGFLKYWKTRTGMKNINPGLIPEEKALFAAICQGSKTINSTLDIGEIMEILLDMAIRAAGAERGGILFKEKPGPEPPEFQLGREIQADTLYNKDFQASLTVINQVLESKKAVVSDNAPKDFNASQSLRLSAVRSILCVPLVQSTGETIGVIYLDSKASSRVFNETDLQMVSALADQGSVAMHNAWLYHKLEKSYLGAVRCLARSIGYKDNYTLEHCQRVSEYSRKIAQELKLDEELTQEIEISALLHDVGKIGIEESVLRKPGDLSREEREQIEKHPGMGFEILEPLGLSENVRLGILHHQERFDGSGYPDRLLGEEIPLIARVIAVADSWDAMTSDRAYRKALPEETAKAEIKNGAGKQFDPIIVQVFLKIISRETS